MFVQLILLTVLFGIAFIFKWRLSRSKLYQLSDKIKGFPEWPFIGNALEFWLPQEKLLEKVLSLTKRERPHPLKAWLGPRLFVYLSDVKHIEKILSSNKMSYKDKIYKVLEPIVGQGLVTASGPRWRLHRKLISPLFSQKHITGYLKVFEQNTKILVDLLKPFANGKEFDINHHIHFCTTDIVYETLTDTKLNSQIYPNSDFVVAARRCYEICFERILKIWLQYDVLFKFSPVYKEFEKFKKILLSSIKDAITKAKENFEENKKETFESDNSSDSRLVSTLEMILNAVKNDTTIYSDEELVFEIFTIFIASQDTTNTMTSFIILMLGAYPEIQERVYNEVHGIRGDGASPITYSELNQMEYLEMVIKETTRLFPVAPYILRQCFEDFQLDENIIIPPDVTVIVGINDVHRQKEHWEKPNEFYPEHFLPEKVAKRHPHSFVAFSAGIRSCIGKLYASATIKTIISGVLLEYKVVADRKLNDLPLKTDISIRSAVGYNVKLLPRKC